VGAEAAAARGGAARGGGGGIRQSDGVVFVKSRHQIKKFSRPALWVL